MDAILLDLTRLELLVGGRHAARIFCIGGVMRLIVVLAAAAVHELYIIHIRTH